MIGFLRKSYLALKRLTRSIHMANLPLPAIPSLAAGLFLLAALFAASCGESPAKERERLQNEIAIVEDSLKFYFDLYDAKGACPDYTLGCLLKLKEQKNSIKERHEYFTLLLDSLTLRLRELPK